MKSKDRLIVIGGDDYLNCPFTEEEYHRFYDALVTAEPVPLHAQPEPSAHDGRVSLSVSTLD